MKKWQHLLVMCAMIFPLFSSCTQMPKPVQYDLPPDAEVIPPKPTEYNQILIREPYASTGYLVKDATTISAINDQYDNRPVH